MTVALAIGFAALLLATARWALTRRHTAGRVYPPRGSGGNTLPADAGASLERSRDLGAARGHLWAWRDLLSDTAARASEASGGNEADGVDGELGTGGDLGTGGTYGVTGDLGTGDHRDALRRDLDTAEKRIRSALADLERRAGTPERRGPWSG